MVARGKLSWTVAQGVLVDLWNLVGPVQLGESGGGDKVPCVFGQVRVAAEGGEESGGDDGRESSHCGQNTQK